MNGTRNERRAINAVMLGVIVVGLLAVGKAVIGLWEAIHNGLGVW